MSFRIIGANKKNKCPVLMSQDGERAKGSVPVGKEPHMPASQGRRGPNSSGHVLFIGVML